MAKTYLQGTNEWIDEDGKRTRPEGGFGSPETAASTAVVPEQHALGALPNYGTNLAEAKRLHGTAAGWKPSATAATTAAPTWNDANAIAARDAERAQLGRLYAAALGGGPSVAQYGNVADRDAVVRAQMGAGKAGGALGLRSVLGAGANMHGTNAIGYGAGRAGEQQSAWGHLANAAFGSRGADLAAASEKAQIAQKVGLANAGNEQAVSLGNMSAEQRALYNELAAAQGVGGLVQDSYGVDQDYRAFLAERERRARAVRDRSNQADQAAAAAGVGAGASLMTFGAMNMGKPPQATGETSSDKRAKTNIEPARDDYRDLLEHAVGYRYEYKDPNAPGAAPGTHLGPMAQDLEKSRMGAEMVRDTPHGKMVDTGRTGMMALSAASYLNDRLDSLEDRYRAAFGGER